MFHEIRAGFKAALHQIDVVSNNMSNAKTTGFKRSEAMFEDLYANNFSGSEIDRGMAARVIENKRSHIQGSMIQTKQTLDMAVSGRGMFMLSPLPGTTDLAYTRDGSFSLTKDGDVIAFDYRTVHGAPPNTSRTKQRRAFSLRLVGDNARFVRHEGRTTSPPFPDVTLKHGAPLEGVDFPILYLSKTNKRAIVK